MVSSCGSLPSLRTTKRTVSPSRTSSAFNEKALSMATTSMVRVTLAGSPGRPPLGIGPWADAGAAHCQRQDAGDRTSQQHDASPCLGMNRRNSVQTRGGGGSWVKRRPMRLGSRTLGSACDDATAAFATVAGNSATAPDISGQHTPAACLAVPCSGQGSGGGAWSGTIDRRDMARRRVIAWTRQTRRRQQRHQRRPSRRGGGLGPCQRRRLSSTSRSSSILVCRSPSVPAWKACATQCCR